MVSLTTWVTGRRISENIQRKGPNSKTRTDEALVLFTRSERSVRGLVARSQFGTLSDGVLVGSPHEFDSVSDRGVDSEGVVTEDTLSRSDNDGVGAAGSRAP